MKKKKTKKKNLKKFEDRGRAEIIQINTQQIQLECLVELWYSEETSFHLFSNQHHWMDIFYFICYVL